MSIFNHNIYENIRTRVGGRATSKPIRNRLEQRGWLRAEWRDSETGREAKFYTLTRAGEKQLVVEKESWKRLTAAVRLIFNEEK